MTASTAKTSDPTPQSKWNGLWKLLLPLALQLAIVASIPIQPAITRATGTTAYISTAPVDPYDLLRGRYVTLSYSMENTSVLEILPGWRPPDEVTEADGSHPSHIYIIIAPEEPAGDATSLDGEVDENDGATSPTAWQPVAVAYKLPTDLPDGRLAIEARILTYGFVDIGLSQYFIPEAIGDELERDMWDNRMNTVAEIKVDSQGQTALLGLWVEDRRY